MQLNGKLILNPDILRTYNDKLAKAQQLGVRTLTEQEFEDMIAE